MQSTQTCLAKVAEIVRMDLTRVTLGARSCYYDTLVGEFVVDSNSSGKLKILAETPLEKRALEALTDSSNAVSFIDALHVHCAAIEYDQRQLRWSARQQRWLVCIDQQQMHTSETLENALDILLNGKAFVKKNLDNVKRAARAARQLKSRQASALQAVR